MTIELSNIGELLVARMLATVANRRDLENIRCAASGKTLASDLGDTPPEFIADRALLRVHDDEKEYACDGAQTVDVLAAVGDFGVAFELKLGLTRMSQSAFQNRFYSPCGISSHADPRLTGSMVAVLDRFVPFAVEHIKAVDDERTWRLAKNWWLVIRQQVWRRWQGQVPVRYARILVFDDLAKSYGGPSEFDHLVSEIVANNFANRWKISFGK